MKLLFVETKQFTRRISEAGWEEVIYLLFVYPKGEQAVLTDEQRRMLRPLIDAFKRGR